MPNEKSSSFSVSNRFFWPSVRTEYASDSVSLGVSTSSLDALTMSPSTRIWARPPATMWRSEASFSIISSSRARRFTGMRRSPSLGGGLLHHFLERRDPPLHLHHAVHPEGQHPLLHSHLPQLFGRAALQDAPAQRAGQRHDLVQPLPALVPRPVAGVAPRPLGEGALARFHAEGMQLLLGIGVRLLAPRADPAHQPLGHDQVDRARHV